MSDYIQLPLDPPYPASYIVTGTRYENENQIKVYLEWTEESGGWYQWTKIKAHAEKFNDPKTGLALAKICSGPLYNIPKKATVITEEVESDKAKEYRRVIEDAIKVINNNE